LQRNAEGDLYVMLHSGSRSVGKKVCDYWHKQALALNQEWFSVLPDKELAYLPWATYEAKGYFDDMTGAMQWAEENRRRMNAAVEIAVSEELGAQFEFFIDIHHNYAAWENHRGRNGIVHRKGAVKAGLDDVVLIPGSMGTASYVGRGLGNEESFSTCQHGAGRARSRGETRRMTNVDAMHEQMAEAGVLLSTPNDADVTDESAIAYKDIEEVMDASDDLVQRMVRLTPLGVVKG
jgi:tRNA-splicing ligase RtcB